MAGASGLTPGFSWKCWFTGWVISWAISVYGASAVIAALALSPGSPTPDGIMAWAATTFHVADLTSPAAKIVPGVLIAIGYGLIARRTLPLPVAAALSGAVGMAAVVIALAILPEELSGGFGIGLSGTRFDAHLVPVYLAAWGIGGIVFALTHARCRAASTRGK